MNILITGSTGLLGRHLVASLKPSGHRLRALVRTLPAPGFLHELECVEGDVEIPESLVPAFAGVDLVIHAAALVSFDPRDRERLHAVNAMGTRNVVDACLQNRVPRLLLVSSVAAVGGGGKADAGILSEDTPSSPDEPVSAYAQSKFESELEAFRGAAEGLKIQIINPSVILAPAAPDRSSGRLVSYVSKGPAFHTSGMLNVVDVRDVVDVLIRLIGSEGHWEERFILSAAALPWREFLTQAARRTGRKPPWISAPKAAVYAAAFCARWWAACLGRPAHLTMESARAAFGRRVYEGSKISRLLGARYRTMDETMDWIFGNP